MGEVYRARDERLCRDVALKVLPSEFARDAQRMARFGREAQLLAALNHPHIATLYGLEESGSTRALAMELVEGPTLAERIAQGPLPLDEILALARQIAEALEYAHEHGIIHRDLKPPNVKVTPEGTVKVLDFGLAKALAEESAPPDISNSPTLSGAATKAGHILGTAAYMSPEQARGKPADRRADIWSFGVLLYEMLTGKPSFPGETVSDTLAAVLRAEPDWSVLPAATPPRIRRLLRRCLEKDPKRRLQAIGEARITLEEQISGRAAGAASAVGEQAAASPPARGLIPWVIAAAFAVITAVLSWNLLRPAREAPKPVTRFSLQLPATQSLKADNEPALVLSPDGSRLVYLAAVDAWPQLMFRSLNRLEAAPLPGTQNAEGPFFSPDGNWVGFSADNELKKVSVNGGPISSLAQGIVWRGATWGPDDTIVYAPQATSGLMRVPASGGAPQAVTQLDPAKKERTHRWPQFLPGGKAVLFTVGTLDSPDYYDDARIDAVVLATGERRVVYSGASMARYVPTGHLVLARGGGLFAVEFDAERLKVTGSPIPVLEGLAGEEGTGAVHFSLADNGTLTYVPGGRRGATSSFAWVDRSGTFQQLTLPPRAYLDPSLSPDGTRLAVASSAGKDQDIWVYDFPRATLNRLTFGGSSRAPHWSPDGKRIAYSTLAPDGKNDIYIKAADGSGTVELVSRSDYFQYVSSWSPDGKKLVCGRWNEHGTRNIWVVSLEGDRKPGRFSQAEFVESNASISPDGRWLAYVSLESGRYEVYVRPFDGSPGKWQVSTEGGREPRWPASGRELYYRSLDSRMMVAAVEAGARFRAGAPRTLFSGVYNVNTQTDTLYDVAPDGRRFLMEHPSEAESNSRQMNVVLNWFEELRSLTAATKK